jgi:hypothetical protein
MPRSAPVVITLPDPEDAPGFKASLSDMSEFRVQDFGTSAAVEPREGHLTTRDWFTAYRLCDDQTVLSSETWEPLRQLPPRAHPTARRDRLLAIADRLAQSAPEDLPRQLAAFRARVFALGPDLPEFLQEQMTRLFPTLPQASLWFVSTDETLLARFAFLRTQLALTLTPDIRVNREEFEGLRLLGAHSLTDGTNFASVFQLPLLIFSPAVMGFVMSCPPHALVLFFGANLELRRNPEEDFNDLFRPRVHDRPMKWGDPPFWEDVSQADAEVLLPWWVARMNVLFSHASDPTRFADSFGRHDPGAQTAWHLTLERALADASLLLSDPNQADIIRSQIAFDLLDKCESLLGYSRSGPGFKELLRRSGTVRRLNRCWEDLPGGLPRHFRRHTRRVFDAMYEDVREHALANRRTKRGMLVAADDPLVPRPLSMEGYVSQLMRTARNSAHGLARPLRGAEGLLTATHDGEIPTQLSDVAALVLFGLVAGAEDLCAGQWWNV